ncbi:MAG: histidine kinase [Actinomycetota bacterium]|nr:histidine kinase [Actinomycetota bacterium]
MNPFRPPITSLRWGAVAVGLVLAVTREGPHASLLLGAATLVGYAAWRTRRPLPLTVATSRRPIAVEALVHVAVVVATGSWESPFALSLLTAVVAIGFARGYASALGVALVSSALVAAPYHLTTLADTGPALGLSAQWTVELLLVAAIAGYARRFSVEAAERHGRDLDRLERLAQANALLHSLHDVAQALPASLDLDEALDSVVARVRSFFELTAVAVFLPDERDQGWTVARQQGARLPYQLPPAALPRRVATALDPPLAARRADLTPATGDGVAASSRSGLYAPLCARGEVVAIVAVEHEEPRRFSARDVEVIDGFAEGAALAIDNARRFAQLRRAGADEERSRIAGELHDRVGQSLACMAFEIDLLVRHRGDDELRSGLEGLGRDLRAVIGDIRDTLSDLRTDVSEARGLEETVEALLARVNERRGTKAVFHYGTCRRLPLRAERVLWRVVVETVNQAVRQGDCSLEVWWACDGANAQLEIVVDVADWDGDWSEARWTRTLADQAAGIGAVLELDVLDEGTSRLRCSLAA